VVLRGQPPANALGKIGDAWAVEPLVGALEDDNHEVRVAAAEALCMIGDVRGVESLRATLDDKRADVRKPQRMPWGESARPHRKTPG